MLFRTRQTGMTLVELMVAMVIGLIIIVAVSALFLTNQQTSRHQDEHSIMQDNARTALDRITYTAKHAGFAEYFGGENANASDSIFGTATADSNAVVTVAPGRAIMASAGISIISGKNDQSITGFDAAHGLAILSGTRSDEITLGYQVGTVSQASASQTGQTIPTTGPLDCLGRVPFVKLPAANSAQADQPETTILNRFYIDVSNDVSGKPQPVLKCDVTYQGYNGSTLTGTATGVIANNVERLQILYGEDINLDGKPDRFVPAGTAGLDMTHVVAIKVALLMRDKPTYNQKRSEAATYNMFGPLYASSSYAGTDTGTSVTPLASSATACSLTAPCWNRRVFETTIMLRNASAS